MRIGGFQKSSLLDYPGKIAAIIFTSGCNFRCGYCHNPELFTHENQYEEEYIIDFLKKRRGLLDSVVVTGGEPCLQNDILSFISTVKNLGYLVKLDSNGTFPDVIKECIDEKLIDYIAMDIKASIEKYNSLTEVSVNSANILKSISLIKNSGIDYEFRTTVVKNQLSFEDFEQIGEMLQGAQKYYLQKFVPTKTLNPAFMQVETYSDEEFEKIKELLESYVKEVYVR